MSDCGTLECAPHSRPSRHYQGLLIPAGVIARWFRQILIRRQWKQRSKISPALLDDIGLTPQQAGFEASGFFWHV